MKRLLNFNVTLNLYSWLFVQFVIKTIKMCLNFKCCLIHEFFADFICKALQLPAETGKLRSHSGQAS